MADVSDNFLSEIKKAIYYATMLNVWWRRLVESVKIKMKQVDAQTIETRPV